MGASRKLLERGRTQEADQSFYLSLPMCPELPKPKLNLWAVARRNVSSG